MAAPFGNYRKFSFKPLSNVSYMRYLTANLNLYKNNWSY